MVTENCFPTGIFVPVELELTVTKNQMNGLAPPALVRSIRKKSFSVRLEDPVTDSE